MSYTYTSNAEWTKIGLSTDTHKTREMAQGVCDQLMHHYGFQNPPCDTRGHCKKAWVEEFLNIENEERKNEWRLTDRHSCCQKIYR